MAKISAKKTGKQPVKKAVVKSKAAPKKVASSSIDKIIPQVLDKLISLDAEHKLQADIRWCLGSFRHDKNPKGLYETGARALKFLTETKKKNSKSIPAKLITDLGKALKKA